MSVLYSFLKPVELMSGTPREHSLICKGPVEVLVLDKEVRIAAQTRLFPEWRGTPKQAWTLYDVYTM